MADTFRSLTASSHKSASLDAEPAHEGEDETTTSADVHIHTSCSDGQATPEAVVDYVRRRTRLNLIAITDHDTIAGAQPAADYPARLTDSPVGLTDAEA